MLAILLARRRSFGPVTTPYAVLLALIATAFLIAVVARGKRGFAEIWRPAAVAAICWGMVLVLALTG